MRRVFAAVVACALTAGLASAQMKAPAPTPNPLQVTTSTAAPAAGPSLESARRINRDEAIKLVRSNKAVYVDVRSKESFAAGHIKGALSIPGSQLVARVREIPTGKLIITYCAWVSEHTSARAVLDLNAHGIKNAAALLGGWNEWTALGLPSEVSKKR